MNNKNISLNKKTLIKPESDIVYASTVGIGVDDEELRLILFKKRLVSDGDEVEIINESDIQVILTKKAAMKLKDLLNEYFNE